MTKVPVGIMPKTVWGRWSVWLIVAMPFLFFLGSTLSGWLYDPVNAGDTLLADIAGRPALALSMLGGMLAGVAAFITGLWAIIKKKERALLVNVSIALGAILIVFLAGEILFPH